jgi:uncharacterized Zn-finger protein
MASRFPKFRNDRAVEESGIGVKEVNCICASPPHDHPQLGIDMDDKKAIHCPD